MAPGVLLEVVIMWSSHSSSKVKPLSKLVWVDASLLARSGRSKPLSGGEDRGSEARRGGGGIGSRGISPEIPRDRSGVSSGMGTELLGAGGGGGGTLEVAMPCCVSTWTRRYGVPG